jgi:CTP:molybdopterin cytidylyltransferase MocA
VSGPALVLLAAGASERLGTCKALVDLAGRTPLARLLAAGVDLRAAPPLVVAGRDHAALRAAIGPGVDLAHNPRWRLGRTGSVQLAASLRPGLALCLAPVDVPRVPRSVFGALLAAWLEAGEPPRGWLAPLAAGPPPRHGHPVVLGPDLLELGRTLDPDAPLRELRGQAGPLLSVPVPGSEVLESLDTPEDLEHLRAKAAKPEL